MVAAIDAAMNRPGPFDFADRAFVPVIRDQARGLIEDRATWHVPDVETLFVQRKVSGTALLAARLKARVDVRSLAADAIGSLPAGRSSAAVETQAHGGERPSERAAGDRDGAGHEP